MGTTVRNAIAEQSRGVIISGCGKCCVMFFCGVCCDGGVCVSVYRCVSVEVCVEMRVCAWRCLCTWSVMYDYVCDLVCGKVEHLYIETHTEQHMCTRSCLQHTY